MTDEREQPKPRWRRWLRRGLKITAWTLGVLVFAVVVVLLALHTDWGREKVRAQIESALDDAFAGDVSIEKIEGSLLGDFEIVGLAIRDHEGEVAIGFERLTVRYRLLSLLSKEVEVEDLIFVDLRIGARQTDRGINLANLMAPSEDDDDDDDDGPSEPSPWRIVADNIELRSSRAELEDGSGTEAISNIELVAELGLAGGALTVSLEKLAGVWTNRELPFSVAAELRLDQDGATVEQGSIALGEASVSIDAVKLSATGAESFEIRGAIPLEVARAVAPGIGLLSDVGFKLDGGRSQTTDPVAFELSVSAGSAKLTGNGTVELETPRARATLSAERIDLEGVWTGLPDSELTTEIELDIAGKALADLRGTVAVTGAGRVHQSSIKDLVANLTIADEKAQVDLKGAPDGGTLSVVGGFDIGAMAVLPTKVVLTHARAEQLLAPFADVGGSIELDTTASGPIDSIKATGKLSGSPRFFGNRARDLSVVFDLQRAGAFASGTATVKTTSLVAGGTAIGSIDASVELAADRTVGFDVDVRGPRASHRLDVDGKVTLGEAAVGVSLNDTLIAVRGLRWTGAGGTLTYDQKTGALEVDQLNLDSPAGVIAIDGEFGLAGGLSSGAAKIVARDLELADFGRALGIKPALAGRITVTAELDVAKRKSRGDIAVKLAGVRYGEELPPASGQLTARLIDRALLANAEIELADLGTVSLVSSARGPRSAVDVGAWGRLGIDAVEHTAITASIADLGKLPKWSAQLPTAGSLEVSVVATDRVRDVTVKVTGRDVVHPQFEEPATVAAEASVGAGKLDAKLVAMMLGRAHVRVTAAADVGGAPTNPASWSGFGVHSIGDVEAVAYGLDVDYWLRELHVASAPLGARAKLTAKVSPRDGTGRLVATLTQAKGGPRSNARATRTVVDVDLGATGVAAKVSGFLDKTKHLDGTATLGVTLADLLASPSALTAAKLGGRFEIDDLPLAAVRDGVTLIDLSKQKPLSGDISLVATAAGTLAEISGGVDIDLDGAVIRGIRFQTLRLGGRYDKGAITATLRGKQHTGGTLGGRFATDLTKGETAPMTADLDMRRFGLAFANELAPGRGIDGALTAHFALRGTRAKPSVTGTAHLMRGELSPGAPLFGLRDLDIKARLTRTALTVVGTGASGRGKLVLDTRVGLRELQPNDLRVTLETTQLPMEAGPFIVSLDTQTRVSGRRIGDDWNLRTALAETTVHLPGERSHSTHPTGVPDDLVFIDQAMVAEQKRGKPKLVKPKSSSKIKLAVRTPDNLALRGPQADAVADVKLDITASDTARIVGMVRIPRGWIELFGRRYQIRKAEIVFNNDTQPVLDIELAYDFANVSLIIGIGGTGAEPEIELRSVPARYSDSELLSFVLGASPDDPREETATAEDRATGIASSVLANQMQSLVSDVVPIDVLRIDMADDQAAAEKLTVGKWITRNLFVAYRQRFAAAPDENALEGSMEYRFWKRWFLEVFYGNQDVGGADVLWIKRF